MPPVRLGADCYLTRCCSLCSRKQQAKNSKKDHVRYVRFRKSCQLEEIETSFSPLSSFRCPLVDRRTFTGSVTNFLESSSCLRLALSQVRMLAFPTAGDSRLCNSMYFFCHDCQFVSSFIFRLKSSMQVSNTKLPLAMLLLLTFEQWKFWRKWTLLDMFHHYFHE